MADYVTAEELQVELENLADELGISVSEALTIVTDNANLLKDRVATNETAITTLQGDVLKIVEVGELDTVSIAEKIIAINETIGEASDDVIKSLFDRIAENKSATIAVDAKVEADRSSLVTYKQEVSDAQVAQDEKIDANISGLSALDSRVVSNKTASEDRDTALAGRLTDTESSIDTLESDDTVEGSVAHSVKTSVDNAKAGIKITTDALRVDVDANAQAIDELDGATTTVTDALSSRIKVNEDTLNDTEDADGNLVKGIKTRTADTEAKVVSNKNAQTQVNSDVQEQLAGLEGSGLAKGVICGRKATNKFRVRLGQAEKTFDCGDDSGDGETA